jgi:hypothetical protein
VVIDRLHHEEQCLVLLVIIVIKVPKLLLRFPPFDNTTEAGDCKEHLHIPVAAMPIWMVIPRFANRLHSLYDGFDALGLRRQLGDGHIIDFGRGRYELIEIVHDGIDGVVNKDTGRAAVG